MTIDRPIERVRQALAAHGCKPRGKTARCPAHDDHDPSLSHWEDNDGNAAVHCFAGCTLEEIAAALDLPVSGFFVNGDQKTTSDVIWYPYYDADGMLVYWRIRWPRGSSQRFSYRHPSDGPNGWAKGLGGATPTLYRLPQLIETVGKDEWIILVEGERDVHTAEALGLTATTSGSAESWRDEFAAYFDEAKVLVIPDDDPAGKKYLAAISKSLRKRGKVKLAVAVDVPYGNDLTGWVEATDNDWVGLRIRRLLAETEHRPPAREPTTEDGDEPLTVHLIAADTLKPEPVRWAAEGYVPLGAVTLIVARKGEGKSTIAYDKLAAATRGKLPGDLHEPSTVIIATAEDHRTQVALPRLMAAGADLSRVKFVVVRSDDMERGLDLPDDLPDLEKRIEQVGARFLFIDPLVAHMPVAIDSHKDQHVRRVLAPLTAIAERHDLAVLASIHFNKAPSVDVLTRISGSGGIANAARCILCCATDPEDESRRLFWRELSNLAPGKQGCSYRLVTKHVETDDGLLETSGVEWGGAVDVDSRRVLAGPSEEGEHHERDEAVEFLLDLLSDGPVSARDVEKQAKAARISQATLRRAKAQLKVRSRKIGAPGEPGEWRWCLPEGAQATPEDVEDAHLSDVSAFDAFGASSQEAGP